MSTAARQGAQRLCNGSDIAPCIAVRSAQLMDLCRDVDIARRVEARDLGELSRLVHQLETALRSLRLSMGSGSRRIAFSDLVDDAPVQAGLDGVGEGLNAGCWAVGVSRYSNYMNINSLDEERQLGENEIKRRVVHTRELLRRTGAGRSPRANGSI